MAETPTLTEQAFADVWDAICKLADKTGAAPLNKLPGCWYYVVDGEWEIAVNGHKEPRPCNSFHQHENAIDVPSFSIYVEFNGWPAGVLDPFGGSIAAGGLANIFTFRDALASALGEAATR